MKKLAKVFMITMTLCLLSCSSAYAANWTVYVDGQVKDLPVQEINGVPMIQVKELIESYGWTMIANDNAARIIVLPKPNNFDNCEISLRSGAIEVAPHAYNIPTHDYALVGFYDLPGEVSVIKGSYYAPIEFLNVLGIPVKIDGNKIIYGSFIPEKIGSTNLQKCVHKRWSDSNGEAIDIYAESNETASVQTTAQNSISQTTVTTPTATPKDYGNKPAVNKLGASIQATLPAFAVTMNGQVVNNTYREYPFLVYKDITYFPMTYWDMRFLGVQNTWSAEKGTYITVDGTSSEYKPTTTSVANGKKVTASISTGKYNVLGTVIDNSKEDYPIISYKNVAYFPLTWTWCQTFGWKSSFDMTNGLAITTSRNTQASQGTSVGSNTTPAITTDVEKRVKDYYAKVVDLINAKEYDKALDALKACDPAIKEDVFLGVKWSIADAITNYRSLDELTPMLKVIDYLGEPKLINLGKLWSDVLKNNGGSVHQWDTFLLFDEKYKDYDSQLLETYGEGWEKKDLDILYSAGIAYQNFADTIKKEYGNSGKLGELIVAYNDIANGTKTLCNGVMKDNNALSKAGAEQSQKGINAIIQIKNDYKAILEREWVIINAQLEILEETHSLLEKKGWYK